MVQPAANAAPALRRITVGVSKHPAMSDESVRTGNGEVPGNECNRNTNGLLDREDSTIGCSWCLYSSLNAFRFSSKPPGEAQSIFKFTLRFKEWLSSLVSDDVGQIVAIVADQLIPFQQTLGSSSGVDLAEGLEGLVCCRDSCIGVFCDVVWCRRPYFAVTWVYRSCDQLPAIGCVFYVHLP